MAPNQTGEVCNEFLKETACGMGAGTARAIREETLSKGACQAGEAININK